METEKKKGLDKRITIEMLVAMRQKFAALPPDLTHEARSKSLAPEYPQFSLRTMETYSRICGQVCQEVIDRVVAGEISITAVEEFTGGWDEKTQKYMAKEFVDQKMTRGMLKMVKRLKKEHSSMGYAEAIARASGEIPKEQPRKEQKKSLDQILSQIADYGARWRALVDMALEMIRDEESASGPIHDAIFQKAFILRQLIGEQYDSINSRVNRYLTPFRKKIKEVTQQTAGIETQPEFTPIDGNTPKIVEAEFTESPRTEEAGQSPAEEK
jgi:hypothetical protein